MAQKKPTKKQIKTADHNANSCVLYLSTAKNIANRLKKDKSILKRINPNWKCLSHYFNYCLIRDFGNNRKINDKEKDLKDQIRILRQELNDTVSTMNRSIMFFEDQLIFLQESNREELGILKHPQQRVD